MLFKLLLTSFLISSPCQQNDTKCWRDAYHRVNKELTSTASVAATYMQAAIAWEGAHDKQKYKASVYQRAAYREAQALRQCTARLLTQPTKVIIQTPDWYWPLTIGIGAAGLLGGTALGTQLSK